MRSLPFYMDDLNGGFMKIEGILRVEKEKLHFEYQKKDDILEVYKSDLRTTEINIGVKYYINSGKLLGMVGENG